MSMKPGASTRPWASRTCSPGAGERVPMLAMRLLRIRKAPSRSGAPVPSASCALMIRMVTSAGDGKARNVRGTAMVNESERTSKRIARRRVNMKDSFAMPEIFALGRQRDVAQPRTAKGWLCHLRALGAGAEMVPDSDENDGDDQDERGDSVNFWSDAAAQAAPDFERQSVFAAVEEKSDGDFVHGKGEDEQRGSDEREFEIGKRDEPESTPGGCAEVQGSFFLTAIHFLQAGEEFGGRYGDERGAVAQQNGD